MFKRVAVLAFLALGSLAHREVGDIDDIVTIDT